MGMLYSVHMARHSVARYLYSGSRRPFSLRIIMSTPDSATTAIWSAKGLAIILRSVTAMIFALDCIASPHSDFHIIVENGLFSVGHQCFDDLIQVSGVGYVELCVPPLGARMLSDSHADSG